MTATAIVIAGASTILKKVLDDLYVKVKELGVNQLGRVRSDLKEDTVARALSKTTKVKTLWNVEKEVSLYEFYYPSSVIFSEGAAKRIASLKELGLSQNFVLQGTAGQGKSIFLRYLCGQELVPNLSSNRIPLFVELRRLRTDLSVKSLILEALEKYKLPHSESAWSFLAHSGKFVLLMDAFDEVDPALATQAVADIETLSDLYAETLQIIITSRPDADIQRSPRFRVCKLAPLTAHDHLPFLNKICFEKGQAEALMRVLQSSSTEIRDLLTTPLMLTLLVILYKSLQTVPDTVPKFYEELFDVLFYRHDHSKPGFRRKRYTQLDDSKIKKLFSAFCFYVRLEGLGVLTAEQLHTCVSKANKASNELVDPDKFKDELTKTVCLMQQDGFEYSFIHKSVTQYYAASFVRGSSDEFANKFYELAARPRHTWDLELRFLSQIDTYRYMKWYELPLLLRIAADLSYSFDQYDQTAESRLQRHLMAKISLVFRPFDEKHGSKKEPDGVFAWSHVVMDDPIQNELGRLWIKPIMSKTSDPAFIAKLLAVKISDEDGSSRPRRKSELCAHFEKEISDELPDLAKRTLSGLQERYESAMAVLRTEDEKTAMLAALL